MRKHQVCKLDKLKKGAFMKFKKSLSIAAASIMAAGLIGCGGGGSSSSSSTDTTQLTAVDDYIYNARVVAVVAENNTTKEYNLTTDVVYKTLNDGKWHGGSAQYAKPAELAGKRVLFYK